MDRPTNVVKRAILYTAVLLAQLGLIDEERGKRIADLAWPRFLTGLARKSQTTADLAMVGLAIGPAAIAGLGFALAYWSIVSAFGWSLANGAMTFFSQRFGAGDEEGLDLAVKQTLWIEFTLAGIFTVLVFGFAEQLVGILGAGPAALGHATLYLQIVAIGFGFKYFNQVATRILLCANDAWSPMVVRVTGALLNIVLNAVFVFVFDLGIFGVALGTVLAMVAVSVTLSIGLFRGRLPLIGSLPVQLSVGPPYVEWTVLKQIAKVGAPLVGKRLVSRSSNLIMLAIVANFGTIIVAAYAVAREIRNLMNTPSWGFGSAARSLVGQELGDSQEGEAEAYGWDILRFTMVVHGIMSVVMFLFADQLAPLFSDDPQAVAAATPFIMVMAISLLGIGIDEISSANLSAAGDTKWPLYARMIGLYVFMIPIAYLGVITPLGVLALYLAVTAETVVPAVIAFYRFTTGEWKIVSRQYRSTPTD